MATAGASGSVVVTGTSTGIGRACVNSLVAAGFHVWATVRADEDAASLHEAYHDEVTVLRMDLTDAGSIEAVGARVRAAGPVVGLVNNAGVALPGPLEFLPPADLRRQLEINVVGHLAVTQEVLPALRLARQRGSRARIVMIGSIAGRIAGPMLGPYHSSKFALVGLSDTLRAELAPAGIEVILIEPGAISTPIWKRGTAAADTLVNGLPEAARSRYAAQIATVRANAARSAERGLPAERVARVVVESLRSGRARPRRLIGTDAHVAAAIARLPFAVRYRLMRARA